MITATFRVLGSAARAQALVDLAHRGYVGKHPTLGNLIIVRFKNLEDYKTWRKAI